MFFSYLFFLFFFFNDTATTEIYTLSLHDALPISYFGGSSPTNRNDVGLGVAVNVVGKAYITGLAGAPGFSKQKPIFSGQAARDHFFAQFTPAGKTPGFFTRMSGPTPKGLGPSPGPRRARPT